MYNVDMVFNEDSTLMSLFDKYEDKSDLKEAILKYCHGGVMNMNRLAAIDITIMTETSEVNVVN